MVEALHLSTVKVLQDSNTLHATANTANHFKDRTLSVFGEPSAAAVGTVKWIY